MLALCERFGCLPSQLLDEDASLWGLLQIEQRARPAEDGDEGVSPDGE